MARLTQEQLEEMVEGKKPNPNAVFYEHAALNVERSKASGHRMYDKKVYIKLSNPGIADSMSYEAQKADIQQYRDEYEYFLQNKQGIREPGIEIIPNLDIAHLQELRDYGILTIPKLAEMELVPPHLEYAQRAAKVFNQALQETSHVSEEESIEEESPVQTRDVQKADRQEHCNGIGRRAIPESSGDQEAGQNTRGDGTGGRIQRNNPVDPDNWSMEFQL